MKAPFLTALLLGLPLAAQEPDTAEPEDIRKASSYGFGYRTGVEFADDTEPFGITPADLDMDAFLRGFLDAHRRREPGMPAAELEAAMQALGDLIQQREQQLATANLAAGQAFLEDNGRREGVVTTASGLQYEVLEAGGDERYVEPGEGQPDKQFLIRYRSRLIDGTELDTTHADEPVPLVLRDTIAGMHEAVTSMPVGARWRLFIPADLAYGEERRSAEIGPNSTLIFDLDLVAIEDVPRHPAGIGLPTHLHE